MGFIRRWKISRSPFFQLYPVKNGHILETVDRLIAVDRARSFIYFRIPKAANSTVAVTLYEGDRSDGFDSKDAKRSFLRARTLTREEAGQLQKKFFLFTFVRDPYSRLASAYLDKIVRNKPNKLPVAKFYGRALTDPVSSQEFCDFIDGGGRDADEHWFRQVDIIPCGVDKLHFIGKVESLDEDLRSLREKLLGSQDHGDVQNWVPHRTDASTKLQSLYCPRTVAVV